ncbi:MAG: hypothetical protein IT448_06780 [Phycisphaerales bacterium]|nr:hypothetical protein [Phycisphaerales bacterium]
MKMQSVCVPALVAGVLAISAVSTGSPILDQNFDNANIFPTGQAFTPTGLGDGYASVGHWYARDGGDRPPRAMTNEAYSDAQSVQMIRSTGTVLYGVNNSNSLSGGSFDLSYYIWKRPDSNLTDEIDDRASFSVFLADSSDFDDLRIGVNIDAGGLLQVYSKTGYKDTAAIIPEAQWIGIRQNGDLTAGTFNTYVDFGSGWTQVDNGATFTTGSWSVNAVQFYPNAPVGGEFFVDNVYLGAQAIPEPTSAAIIFGALSSLILMRR